MNENQTNDASSSFSLRTWAKLLPFARPMMPRFIITAVLMAISAAVDACIPLFISHAVNTFVVPRTTDGLAAFTIFYAAAIVVQSITTVFFARLCMVIEMRLGQALKKACFVHLQQLSISFYDNTSVGYLLARVMSDTSRISGMVAWGMLELLFNAFYLIGIFVAMFSLNVSMSLMVVCVVPVFVALTLFFIPRFMKAGRAMRRANSRITGAFNENVNGARTSKVLVIEDRMSDEFKDITRDMRAASLRTTQLRALYGPMISFFGSFAVALVLQRGGLLVNLSLLDFGLLSAFISYAVSILEPIAHIADMIGDALGAQVNIERVFALLEQPLPEKDSEDTEEVYGTVFDPRPENYPPIRGDIELRDVWFKYPGTAEDEWVLKDVSLHVPAGATIAIVGETGAGKSTLVNLICRFIEPTRGEILIDGVNYLRRSRGWLHSNLGYVQQTPHLFSGTVRSNIRYGKLDASDGDVLRAAALVSADTVANKLENGFDTDVGEGGSLLSTGEKQLVSFARAVIANPPIFILDEATSSIDTETEQLIQNAISNILTGRTSFVIAHRLSTIRGADLILLVDEHRIVERGTHAELMAARGKYYELYTAMKIKESMERGIK